MNSKHLMNANLCSFSFSYLGTQRVGFSWKLIAFWLFIGQFHSWYQVLPKFGKELIAFDKPTNKCIFSLVTLVRGCDWLVIQSFVWIGCTKPSDFFDHKTECWLVSRLVGFTFWQTINFIIFMHFSTETATLLPLVGATNLSTG